jgi:hypothetical protein
MDMNKNQTRLVTGTCGGQCAMWKVTRKRKIDSQHETNDQHKYENETETK